MENKWAANEGLLQSYRGVFIMTQSIFVAAAAATKDVPLLSVAVIAVAISLLAVGFTVVSARAKVVDFYKFNVAIWFNKQGYRVNDVAEKDKLDEHTYVHNKKIRIKVNKDIGIKTWRRTRIKIDAIIPILFMLLWLAFLWNALYPYMSVLCKFLCC